MRRMMISAAVLCAAALCVVVFSSTYSFSAAAEEPVAVLWRIGKSDNDTRELALAPNRYDRFTDDAFFVVGTSDPAKDWPYVQPGPKDAWAGGKTHVFRVVFGIATLPENGVCRLTIDLVNTHHTAPPVMMVDINGYTFGFVTPKGGSDAVLTGGVAEGKEYRFSGTVPVSALRTGTNILAISNTEGSWIVYDSLLFEAPEGTVSAKVPETAIQSVSAPPILDREGTGFSRAIRIAVFNTVREREAALSCADIDIKKKLAVGESTIELRIPAADKAYETTVELAVAGTVIAREPLKLEPVRKWTIYFLPHSHVDIGYTHLQSEVMHRQWDNIAEAVALAEKTAGYPEGARFKWNLEVLWPLERLLVDGPEERKTAVLDAIRKGQVGVDGLYGSMLTGLARPEELFRFTSFARSLRRDYGVSVTSAMITDVPGYVWGMVPALAHSGIRYFNPGPNHMPMLPHQGDRIGYTSETWGDKPFWWVSPSGEERVLVWIPTHGYSWFHDWIVGRIQKAGIGPILTYLDDLEKSEYPYDMVQLRYTVGADNGPPDPGLPDFVRDWNAAHAWPRLVIATTSEMFGTLEKRYGATLPEYSGDFTPYWEDGAASSAKETALNRNAADRLVSAAVLWSMTDPKGYPAKDFNKAWRNVILYTEHTWGAHNSISEPESDFVKGQWAVKRRFALDADSLSRDLECRALSSAAGTGNDARSIDVYNTSSWARTDIVTIPPDWKTPGDIVRDETGRECLSQRLSTGGLIFLAEAVPPFGTKRFTMEKGKSTRTGTSGYRNGVISNSAVTVGIDTKTGAIVRLERNGVPGNLADSSKGGLNGYYYLVGKDPKDAVPNGASRITIKENGPLLTTVTVTSEAPGCKNLIRDITVYSGLDRIDIVDTVDKARVLEKESVHIAFPFAIPGGQIRYDVAWGVVRPDRDQLPGGNRNVFSLDGWVDVSNDRSGVTLASLDAPLMEIDTMNAEAWNLDAKRPWLKTVPASQTVYSYVMNNYWHTNYKAYQEGPTLFRYSLLPHDAFDPVAAKRFGMERRTPLTPVPAGKNAPVSPLPINIGGGPVIVTSVVPADGGTSLVVRLFNTADKPARIEKVAKGAVRECDIDGGGEKPLTLPRELPGYGIVTVKIDAP